MGCAMAQSTRDQLAALSYLSQDLCAQSQALRAQSVALSAQVRALCARSQEICAQSQEICARSQERAATTGGAIDQHAQLGRDDLPGLVGVDPSP